VGARLNWILHFGKTPRYSKDLQSIIQFDIEPEEIGNNIGKSIKCIPIFGSLELTIMDTFLYLRNQNIPKFTEWISILETSKRKSEQQIIHMKKPKPKSGLMGYYHVFDKIQPFVNGKDVVIISEGANTMDISRTMILHEKPRRRLDAGSFGTMGVGLGFAIAAKIVYPDIPVIVIQGDSAFGFSAMDIETLMRYQLIPITFIIFNNNGIYSGIDQKEYDHILEDSNSNSIIPKLPSTSYLPDTRYEKMSEMVHGKGFHVKTLQELENALNLTLSNNLQKPSLNIINTIIDTTSTRKPQVTLLKILL
jgi:2-hydroxyacyl-CoA lyase 1